MDWAEQFSICEIRDKEADSLLGSGSVTFAATPKKCLISFLVKVSNSVGRGQISKSIITHRNIRTLWIGLNNFQFVRSEIKKLTHCYNQGA